MIVRRVSYFTFMVALTTMATITSCNRAKEKARQSVHYAGEIAGKASTEFFDGAAEGVSATLDCRIGLSAALRDKGFKLGKFRITTDSTGNEHIVSVYLIFDKDYKGPVTAKIFDSKNLEYGRSTADITAVKGDARFVDLVFDHRTDIARKSRILLE